MTLIAEEATFRGWQACRLANEFVQLIAVPDIGGRVMALDLGEHPFLFVDPDLAGKLFSPEENQGDGSLAAWKNYGGAKTWPAPQGWETDAQWHGPPDPLLDSGRYTVDELTNVGGVATLAMTSPPDPRTGVQITRRFTLAAGSSRIQVALAFRNVKAAPIRWSIWDVVQLRADRRLRDGTVTFDPTCAVTTPVNPSSRFARGYNVMFGAEENPQWQVVDGLLIAGYRWEIGKIGLDSPAGWVAFSCATAGTAFVTRFAHDPQGEYPDGGATVECWTVGAGQVANLDYSGSGIYLMETEVLSPHYTLLPGEQATFALEWALCRCRGPVVDANEAGCMGARFAALRRGEHVELSGVFGVFEPGTAEFVWQDGDGRTLSSERAGHVGPLAVFSLAERRTPPPGAAQVALELVVERDGRRLLLATAAIR